MANGFAFIRLLDGSLRVGVGPFRESSTPVDEPCFYLNNWRLGDFAPWKIPARVEKTERLETVLGDPAGPVSVEWKSPDFQQFRPAFYDVVNMIRRGVARKMVPVVTESGTLEDTHAGRRLATIVANAAPPLIPYGHVSGSSGFVGATPEYLFSRSGAEITTMALAGTSPTGARSDFLEDPKEISEHEMVVEHIVAKLVEFGSVERMPREIFDLEGLCHFCSRIRARVAPDLPLEQLIRLLHPTPAVGTLPATEDLNSALLEIREKMGAPDWFGSPFGYFEEGNFQCVVAIRGIGWEGQRVFVPSGCGIVTGSNLEKEWQELALKRNSVKRLFSL